MCSVLKVSRGGFYKWTVSTPSKRSIENQKLEAGVLQAFENSKKIYGIPRITLALHKKDIKISRPRVARIMRKAELGSIVKKKFKITTDSSHKFPVPENVLDLDFKPGVLSAVWVSDITYIRTKKGWLYLTTVIDLGDRKIIG
jgi:putative transposase